MGRKALEIETGSTALKMQNTKLHSAEIQLKMQGHCGTNNAYEPKIGHNPDS